MEQYYKSLRRDAEYSQWELWMADIPENEDNIQCGYRPVLIISTNKNNINSPLVTVLPLTKQEKRNLPTHLKIGEDKYKKFGLRMPSIIMGESPQPCNKKWLDKKIGELYDKNIQNDVFYAMDVHYGRV